MDGGATYTTADGGEVKAITSLTAKADGLKDGVLTLTEGDSVDVDVNIDPIDSTDPTLTWTSSDASVATVEDTENAGKAKDAVRQTHRYAAGSTRSRRARPPSPWFRP